MSETYERQIEKVRLMADGDSGRWDLSTKDTAALTAVLSRLDRLEGDASRFVPCLTQLRTACQNALNHVRELRGAWERGCVTEHDGMGGTRSNRNVDVECELRAAVSLQPMDHPEVQAGRVLYSICVALSIDVWDDMPQAGEAVLEAIEKAITARTFEAFTRGLRAGNVAAGRHPDELPEEIPPSHNERTPDAELRGVAR